MNPVIDALDSHQTGEIIWSLSGHLDNIFAHNTAQQEIWAAIRLRGMPLWSGRRLITVSFYRWWLSLSLINGWQVQLGIRCSTSRAIKNDISALLMTIEVPQVKFQWRPFKILMLRLSSRRSGRLAAGLLYRSLIIRLSLQIYSGFQRLFQLWVSSLLNWYGLLLSS